LKGPKEVTNFGLVLFSVAQHMQDSSIGATFSAAMLPLNRKSTRRLGRITGPLNNGHWKPILIESSGLTVMTDE